MVVKDLFVWFLVWSQEITLLAFCVCFDFLRIDFICYQCKGKCERKLSLLCLKQWKYREVNIPPASGPEGRGKMGLKFV